MVGAHARGDDLAKQQLTVKSFPAFYRRLMGLHFPLEVAEIIDLRDILQHASDDFRAHPQKRKHRHFGAVASEEIQTLGVRATHHRDKLLQILIMLRDLYYTHHRRSLETERSLRRRRASNREAKKISIKYGALALAATTLGVATWAALGDIAWPVKTVTVLLAYVSLDCFYSLSVLNRYYHRLGQELDAVRQVRVRSFRWKHLAYRIALILGYLHPAAVSAFVDSSEGASEQGFPPRSLALEQTRPAWRQRSSTVS